MVNMILSIMDTLVEIGNFIWGAPMMIGLTAIAVLYTIGTGGFQFTHFGYILKNTIINQFAGKNKKDGEKGISSFKAMCMALCNTLGVGNIAGVAVSIALGGPGAVFWIWIAGILGMIIKYGEIILGVKYREIDSKTGMYRGGIMWYVEKGLGKNWKWLAVIYAAVYVVSNINAPAVQINTIAASVTAYFDIPSIAIGVVAAGLMAIVLLGGVKRISAFAEKVVSVMSIAYLAAAVIVLVLYFDRIPATFGMIFKYAFTDAKAIAGGFGGATVAITARYGFARGFYSNGAGTGDVAFAHSHSDVEHPAEQGIWGVSEVVIDTVVCSCTAFVILLTGVWENGGSGAALTAEAISVAVGSAAVGNIFIMLVVAFFAFTTALMCAYYGEICLRYFTENKVIFYIYRALICLWAAFATNSALVERIEILWSLGDFNVGCCIMLSIISLFLLRKDVFDATKEYKAVIKKNCTK